MSDAKAEQEIQQVISRWMTATMDGDLPAVLNLMTEDVVFLISGQPPMRGREAFAEGFRASVGKMKFRGTSTPKEIVVSGDYAFCWSELDMTITPLEGQARHRAGPALSMFRRDTDGKWRLFRDANLVTEAKP